MKYIGFVINDIFAEMHVISALESCGYRWTRRGACYFAWVDDEAFDVIVANADRYWAA